MCGVCMRVRVCIKYEEQEKNIKYMDIYKNMKNIYRKKYIEKKNIYRKNIQKKIYIYIKYQKYNR